MRQRSKGGMACGVTTAAGWAGSAGAWNGTGVAAACGAALELWVAGSACPGASFTGAPHSASCFSISVTVGYLIVVPFLLVDQPQEARVSVANTALATQRGFQFMIK